jgi:hypothetical protein
MTSQTLPFETLLRAGGFWPIATPLPETFKRRPRLVHRRATSLKLNPEKSGIGKGFVSTVIVFLGF